MGVINSKQEPNNPIINPINTLLEERLLSQLKSSGEILTADNQFRLLLYRSLMAVYRSRQDLGDLQKRSRSNYKLCIRLSLAMYIVGILLLLASVIAALSGHADRVTSLSVGGISLLSLISLCLFDPIKRIHEIMGDMAQLSLAVNSFQMQADLLMMEIREQDDTSKPDSATIEKVVKGISDAAESSITLIQKYFENKGDGKNTDDSTPASPSDNQPEGEASPTNEKKKQ